MTPETPTPETDAAVIDGYTFCQEDMRPAIAFCANLERERDAARAEIEVMREVVAAAEKCRHWHDCSYNPATGKTEGVVISADSFWELHTALAKLQPFIKP